MVLKKLTATAKDAWRRRQMPAQIASKDTRLGFAEIIVRALSCYCWWWWLFAGTTS